MAYTAKGLIKYARSLADLQNTQFISYEDEINLINEAYRDVYSRYTESDGDYWVTELVLNVNDPLVYTADPNNPWGGYFTLPADFLKIRSVSYNYSQGWVPAQKFNTMARDSMPNNPEYRLKNDKLWIIAAPGSYSQLKIDYYPVPNVISSPGDVKDVGIDINSSEFASITSCTHDPDMNYYVYSIGNKIYSHRTGNGASTTLLTHTNPVDNVVYYSGYLYFRDKTSLLMYRGKSTLDATVTSSALAPTTVEWFSINNKIITYVSGTGTNTCALDGTGVSNLSVTKKYQLCSVYGHEYYINGSSAIVEDGVATAISAIAIRSNDVDLYWLDLLGDLHQGTYEAALLSLDIIAIDGYSVGTQIYGNYLDFVGENNITQVSLVNDTELVYPTNEVNELLAYTSAIAYARKQSDEKKFALLNARLIELWDRFWSVNKRDEYQFARINNEYRSMTQFW